MARSTIIFGNGLGMALDPAYFSLKSGLAHVWNNSSRLTEEHKSLVVSALPELDNLGYPHIEDQLDKLQLAIVASSFLRSFELNNVEWLSEHSRCFPEAFKQFIHEVATYFHESGQALPIEFSEPLAEYVRESASHVALLNYDNLLYDAFVAHGVANGFNGTLLDGFTRPGFSAGNLVRYDPSRRSWYLHLHGSPLFIDNQKAMRDERTFLPATDRCHIVLTHIKHKPSVIDASPILREYWSRLRTAFGESSHIVLFGYSGADAHLNQLIADRCSTKTIHVVEWEGTGVFGEREAFWRTKLGPCAPTLHHYENILEFIDWRHL